MNAGDVRVDMVRLFCPSATVYRGFFYYGRRAKVERNRSTLALGFNL